MPRFRPPKLPKNLQSLDSAFVALYEDLQALSASRGDVTLHGKTYRASPGETVRVSPPPEGMGLVLPPPSAENRAAEVTVLIERPAGDLRVFVSQDGPAGPSGAPTIDGEEMRTYSTEGALRFVSNGSTRWSDARGEAGATGPTGATGPAGADSAMRRIRRHVFYADGSCDIIENGSTTTVTLGEFGLEADGNAYRAWLVAGGNGGPRGPRAQGTNGISPAAPGGGAVAEKTFWREELEDYIAALGTDIPVTVGAAGAGAAATAADITVVVAAIGTAGGATHFGDLLAAFPAGLPAMPAAVNTTAAQQGGGGGGWLSAGANGGTDPWGGAPLNTVSANAMADGDHGGGVGDLGGTSGSNQGAGSGLYGGGGGGGQQASAAANGRPGGRSLFGVPGAGAGGSWNSSGTARSGGNGGDRGPPAAGTQSPTRSFTGGPAGGSGSAANTDGVAGADGADGILGLYPGESGAGGGAASRDTAGTTSSGRGGDGGFPGGSGGGGGSARSSGVAGCLAIAERGGNPADGVAVIDTLG